MTPGDLDALLAADGTLLLVMFVGEVEDATDVLEVCAWLRSQQGDSADGTAWVANDVRAEYLAESHEVRLACRWPDLDGGEVLLDAAVVPDLCREAARRPR